MQQYNIFHILNKSTLCVCIRTLSIPERSTDTTYGFLGLVFTNFKNVLHRVSITRVTPIGPTVVIEINNNT